MAKRGRRTGRLAQLERQLADLNARRQRIISQIKMAVEHLTLGSAAPMAGLDLDRPMKVDGRRGRVVRATAGAGRVKRQVSAAVRARLSRLAKARWVKAKKEGKTRLG